MYAIRGFIKAVSFTALSALIAVLTGCSPATRMPSLPGPTDDPIERVVLDDSLDAADIRALFRSLNRSGRLDPLRPWLDPDEDAVLERVTRLFNRYVFQQAWNPEGLLGLVDARVTDQELAAASRWMKQLEPQSRDVLKFAFFHPAFPTVASDQSHLLELRFGEILSHALSHLPDLKKETWPVSAPSADLWLGEMSVLMNTPSAFGAVGDFLHAWLDSRSVSSVLAGLAEVRERDPESLIGAAWGISHLASENRFSSVLGLFRELNQPSKGLFSELEKKLIESPQLVEEFARLLEPRIPRSVAGFVGENLKNPPLGGPFDRAFWEKLKGRDPNAAPTQEWIALYAAVRSGVEKVTGTPAGGFSKDQVLRSLPLYVNAYVLTRWLEHSVISQWDTLVAQPDFSKALWKHPLTLSPWVLDLTETSPEGAWVLAAAVKRDFEAIGLGELAQELDRMIDRDGYGEFYYDLAEFKGPLAGALSEACGWVHRSRSFGDPVPLLQALIYGITREEGGFGIRLSELETPNLAVMLHKMLASLSVDGWNRLERWLFEDLGLGDVSSEESQLLLSLYESQPELQKRVRRLIELLPALKALNHSVGNRPSAFSLYVQLLDHVPPAAMESWVKIWSVVDMLKVTDEKRFPSFVQFLKRGEPVAKVLGGLGSIPVSDHAYVTDSLYSSLGEQGSKRLKTLWDWASASLARDPGAWAELADTLPELPSGLSDAERRWLIHFINDGGFADLWAVLSAADTQENLGLVRRLRELSEAGYLQEAFALLAHVHSDSMKRTAESLRRLDASGELVAFLKALEHWLE